MAADGYGIAAALLFGWKRFRANAGFLLLLGLGLGIIMLVANTLQKTTLVSPSLFAITYLITLAINAFISFVFVTAALELHDYETVDFDDLTRALPRFAQFFIGYILFGIAVVIGYLLLIIPGIYLSIKLFFYMYLVVDKGINGIDALKMSYNMTTGHFKELFLFLLSLFVINLIGLLLLGFGMLVTIPVTSIAAARIYRKFA